MGHGQWHFFYFFKNFSSKINSLGQKSESMEGAMDNYGVQNPGDECFDCPTNGKVCGKTIQVAGKTV